MGPQIDTESPTERPADAALRREAELEGELDELLVEEISIDGLCGVY